MPNLIITDLSGDSELLIDYKDLTRKRRVNGERSLSFLLLKTTRNEHAFDLVQEETTVSYDGDDYRIKSIEERLIGTTPVKKITAEHAFFDIIDTYQYTTLSNGSKTISQALSFALANTGYTFSVIDSFGTVTFENFGNDTALALFQKILERYEAEFDIVNTDIKIYTKIGSSPDFQFRYKYNVKTFSRTIRTDNLSTYIKGYGKQNEDGTYAAEAEYTSPMSDIYGIRHAKPVYDERFTDAQALEDYIKTKIIDTPEISLTLDFVDLQKAGYPESYPKMGDTVPLIFEPLNVDLETRLLEIEDYPESRKSARVTLANFNEDFTDVMFRHTKSQLDKIYDENSGKLHYNVLDEAVKLATEALNNSLTELEYPTFGGIIARDPNDPNKYVIYNSAGLGVTTDGGNTYQSAITADGIVTNLLTAGQIKTNNIQVIGNDDLFYWDGNYLIAIDAVDPNKFARLNSSGLYIAKGALTVERPDGYQLIIDGKQNFNLSVQGGTPPYIDDMKYGDGTYVVKQDGPYYTTSSTGYARFDYFRFQHVSRYISFAFYGKGGGGGAHVWVRIEDDLGNTLAEQYTNNTSDTNLGITLDLGTPDGSTKLFYAKFKSTSTSYTASLRLATKYMHD